MPSPVSNSRNATADLLKGTACLCMIQVHLVELFVEKDFAATGLGRFCMFLGGPPAAPVFLAMMGYFIASFSKSAGQRAWRGLQVLGIAFLLNLGLNAHLLIRIKRGEFQFLNPMHYVFGVDILWLAGFSLLLLALLLRVMRRPMHWWEAAILTIIVAAATPLINETMDKTSGVARYFAACVGGTFSWSYFPLFPWFAWVSLGIVARRFIEEPGLAAVPVNGRWIAFVGCLGVTILGGSKTMAITNNLPEYYHHDLRFVIWTTTFLLVWTVGHHWIVGRLGDTRPLQFIRWLGRNITAVYVFQWLIIGNVATAIYQTQSPARLLPWFVGVALLASLLTSGWNRFHDSRSHQL